MDESGIKAAALTRIRRECRGGALPVVASEFSLNGTSIRADLAVLEKCFYGIEIKSAADSLKRLPSQMEGYARYFDRTKLIVAPNHLRGLREIDLYGAEVWRYDVLTDWQLHTPGEKRQISGQWLLHLLPAEDERRASKAVERAVKQSPQFDVDAARRTEFEHAFRRRYAETSASFWTAVSGRPIVVNDLKLLSRYHADRQQRREIDRQRTERWADWLGAMQAVSPAT